MIKEIVKKQPIPIKIKEEISHDHYHHHYKHTHPEEVTKVVKGNKWLSESTEGSFGSSRFNNVNGNGFGSGTGFSDSNNFSGGNGFGGGGFGSNAFGGNGFASSTSYSSTNLGSSAGSQGGSYEYKNIRGGRKVCTKPIVSFEYCLVVSFN